MHFHFIDRFSRELPPSASLFDQPLPLPMVLAVIGGIVWIVAYVLFIIRGHRDRASAMPLVAVCLNITWEFVYTFVYPPVWPIFLPIRLAWFTLDVILLWQVLRWAARDHPEVIARRFGLVVAIALLLALAGHIGFADSFNGIDPGDKYADGHYEAFLLNLVMSILFCLFLLKREPDRRGISLWGGIAKMVGTALYSIASIVIYINQGKLVDGLLLPLLFVSIFLFDLLYILLIVNARARNVAMAMRRRVPA